MFLTCFFEKQLLILRPHAQGGREMFRLVSICAQPPPPPLSSAAVRLRHPPRPPCLRYCLLCRLTAGHWEAQVGEALRLVVLAVRRRLSYESLYALPRRYALSSFAREEPPGRPRRPTRRHALMFCHFSSVSGICPAFWFGHASLACKCSSAQVRIC